MPSFLLHYSSEIGLKGQNRRDFINQLRRNIRRQHPAVTSVEHLMGRLVAQSPQAEDFSDVFGVAWWAEVRVLPPEMPAIVAAAVEEAQRQAAPGRTFAIRARRADKTFPYNSPEIGRQVGAAVAQATGMRVDLDAPDVEVFVEVAPGTVFVFARRHPGPQGFPVGSSGKLVGLYSGGIDSVIATYLMARRGARVRLVHFHVFEHAAEAHQQKVGQLAQRLGRYIPGLQVYYLPYRLYHQQAQDLPRRFQPYRVVAFRRFMARAAAEIARQWHAAALFTGDSLGQVASQTMENLLAVNHALAGFPIFRPLLAWPKQEIIDLGEQLGFYDLAKQPYRDGCALLARKPATRAHLARVEEMERLLDIPALLAATLAQAEVFSYG